MAIFRLGQANRDLVRIGAYLDEAAGAIVAERFLIAAEAAFAKLESMPYLGSLSQHLPSRFADVRIWSISGFRKYLIFYRRVTDGIEVMRVLHGMRDLRAILEESNE